MKKLKVSYLNREDIVYRLLRNKPYWFHGNPEVELRGEEGKFGTLVFDFQDEILYMNVLIGDKEYILDEAWMAVYNFSDIHDILIERTAFSSRYG